MQRWGVRLAQPLILALAVTACGPSTTAATALDAFVGLVSRDDLAYRFILTTSTPGVVQPVTGEGTVVGRDSVLTVTIGGQPESDSTTVIKADQVFTRTGIGPWEVRERRAGVENNDLAFLLPHVAQSGLTAVGTVGFEGRQVHQLSNQNPIELPVDGAVRSTITRLEILVDDAGAPVRLVAEFSLGRDDAALAGLFEMRFLDVGAPVTIEAPAVP